MDVSSLPEDLEQRWWDVFGEEVREGLRRERDEGVPYSLERANRIAISRLRRSVLALPDGMERWRRWTNAKAAEQRRLNNRAMNKSRKPVSSPQG